MTTKIPVELSSTPGIVDNSNATAITIDSSENVSLTGQITIGSGNNIINAGNLTLDVGGDITLDADGGDIKLSNGGTQFANFGDATGAIHIDAVVSDDDIKFRGNDGGSVITALTLDMSEAGTATFNNGVVVQGDLTVQGTTVTLNTATLDVEDKNITLNAGSGDTSGSADGAGITIQDAVDASTDATILWDASNDEFDFSHTANVTGSVVAQTKLGVGVSGVHASYGFYNQNNAYFNGAVIIDDTLAITGGALSITGDGSNATNLTESGSGDFTVDTAADITLDAAGGDVRFKGSSGSPSATIGKLSMGDDNFTMSSSRENYDIIFKGNDGGSTITALTLDMSDAGAATFNHDVKLNDNGEVKFGSSQDLRIAHNSTDSFITNNTGDLYINQFADDKDIKLRCDDGSGGIASYITLDGSAALTQFDKNTKHVDSVKATFGDSADLEIHHDSNNSKITHTGTGGLYIGADTFALQNGTHDENFIVMSDNGAVSLYYDNSAKLATTSSGVDVTGDLKFNSGYGSSVIGYGVRAWVNFNGTGTVAIRDQGNVSSITDNGTGDYTINFATALPDTNYCVVGSGISASSHPAISLSVSSASGAQATGSIRVVVATTGGANSNGFVTEGSITSVAVIR